MGDARRGEGKMKKEGRRGRQGKRMPSQVAKSLSLPLTPPLLSVSSYSSITTVDCIYNITHLRLSYSDYSAVSVRLPSWWKAPSSLIHLP